MKQLLYLFISLAIIVAIIPSVHAAYNCSLVPSVDPYYGSAPWTIESGVTTQAELNAMCIACGYASQYGEVGMRGYDNMGGWKWDSRPAGDWQDRNLTDSNVRYIRRYGTCVSGGVEWGYVRISDGACTKTENTLYDILYHLPQIQSECTAGTYVEPVITFTGSPLSGPAPLSVLFTISNLTNSTGLSWSFGDGNITPSSAATINHHYQNQGVYTVILDYFNVTGVQKSIQKNNYITVGAPNATATTYAVARDLYTGFAINGAQVNMYDVENTSWTNTTTTNGIGSITTLLGHKINIWGSAVGYQDDNLQNMPAVDGGYYSLLLKPSNLTTYNTAAGNLTLIVTVQDLQLPHPTIQGAEVTAAWGSQYASGTTNAAGNTFFTVPNNTAIHLSAFKSGYASGSSTHITGSANGGPTTETAIMYIGTDYVTPVPTVTLTTGPGGTIPQTVDPYPCVGDGSPEDTANCQRKQSSMAADLISYGPDLVNFFIMLTFIGGLLLITKR